MYTKDNPVRILNSFYQPGYYANEKVVKICQEEYKVVEEAIPEEEVVLQRT